MRLEAEQYSRTLITFYHTNGGEHVAARGQLLEFALHGRGKIKTLARQVLASHGINIMRNGK